MKYCGNATNIYLGGIRIKFNYFQLFNDFLLFIFIYQLNSHVNVRNFLMSTMTIRESQGIESENEVENEIEDSECEDGDNVKYVYEGECLVIQ